MYYLRSGTQYKISTLQSALWVLDRDESELKWKLDHSKEVISSLQKQKYQERERKILVCDFLSNANGMREIVVIIGH